MFKKHPELIIKIACVIGLSGFFMVIPTSIIVALIWPIDWLVYLIANIGFLALFVGGITVMVFPFVVDENAIKEKTLRASKISCIYYDFMQLSDTLKHKLNENNYLIQNPMALDNNSEVTVYIKKHKMCELDCFAIIRTDELSDVFLECANDSITAILTKFYRGKRITDKINMISLFCVDRTNAIFRKLLNSNTVQGIKNGRLIAGISFGGGNLYIANQKGGFAITKYKRLRKEFINIMGLQSINR